MPESSAEPTKPGHSPPCAIANFQLAMGLEAEVKVVMGSTTMKFGDLAKLALVPAQHGQMCRTTKAR